MIKKSYVKPDSCSEEFLLEYEYLNLVSSGQIEDLVLVDDTWG